MMEENLSTDPEFTLPQPPSPAETGQDRLPANNPALRSPTPNPDLPLLSKPLSLQATGAESPVNTQLLSTLLEIPGLETTATPDLGNPEITAESLHPQILLASALEKKFKANTISDQQKRQLITLTDNICLFLARLHEQQPNQLLGKKTPAAWYQTFHQKLVTFTGTEALPAPLAETPLPSHELIKPTETDTKADKWAYAIKRLGSGYIQGKFTTPEGGNHQTWGKAQLHDGFQTRGHFGFIDNQTLHEQGDSIQVDNDLPFMRSLTSESLLNKILDRIKNPETTNILIMQNTAPKVDNLPQLPKSKLYSLLTYGFHAHRSTIKDNREHNIPMHVTLFLPQAEATNLFLTTRETPTLMHKIIRRLYPEIWEKGIQTVQATHLLRANIKEQMLPGEITSWVNTNLPLLNSPEYSQPLGDLPA